jgi:hypothetical protein
MNITSEELRIGTMHARTIPVMFGAYWSSSFTAEALGAVVVGVPGENHRPAANHSQI